MKLNAITFTEHPEEGAIPETVTVTLTAREAVWLGTLTGRQSGEAVDALLPGYAAENNAIYHCLVADVANRYFDEGLDEMASVVNGSA